MNINVQIISKNDQNNSCIMESPFISEILTMPIKVDILDFCVHSKFYIRQEMICDENFKSFHYNNMFLYLLSKFCFFKIYEYK